MLRRVNRIADRHHRITHLDVRLFLTSVFVAESSPSILPLRPSNPDCGDDADTLLFTFLLSRGAARASKLLDNAGLLPLATFFTTRVTVVLDGVDDALDAGLRAPLLAVGMPMMM